MEPEFTLNFLELQRINIGRSAYSVEVGKVESNERATVLYI
jgi:hypothetical protein